MIFFASFLRQLLLDALRLRTREGVFDGNEKTSRLNRKSYGKAFSKVQEEDYAINWTGLSKLGLNGLHFRQFEGEKKS